jgi:polysaccharide biosynthesis/export protein
MNEKSMVTILIVVLLALGCSADATKESTSYRVPSREAPVPVPTQPESKSILVGDSVAFSVWGYPEFATRAVVKETGTISVPLAGEVLAAGYSRDEFAAYLKQRLAEFIKGEIKLLLEVTHPVPRITVLGAVSRQGSYPTKADIPLLEVLSNAGGWTEKSDLRYVRISRQSTQSTEGGTIEVNLESYLDSGNMRSLPVVHPGDVVFIPEKENVVREVSEFLRDAFILLGFFNVFK